MDPEEQREIERLLESREQLIGLIYKLISDILQCTREMETANTKFHAAKVPGMRVKDYLERISKYAHCSNASYVIALIYLDRLQEAREELILNQYCVHKFVNSNFGLLISAIVLAAKYNDDEFYKNVYYAKVGGINLAEMNTLEALFAEFLDYNFFVKPEDFNKYLHKLAEYDRIQA